MIRVRLFGRRRAAGERLAEASAERAESERRLAEVRANVVEPLLRAAARNNFAELIRQNLQAGHGHPSPGAPGRGTK